jgi:hypothetical protein
MKKRWPLITWTMGFRPRQDQYDAIERMRELNPNVPSWSELLRIGLDRIIAELRVPQTNAAVYQSISTYLGAEAPSTGTVKTVRTPSKAARPPVKKRIQKRSLFQLAATLLALLPLGARVMM